MKIIALMIVKDEDDIVGYCLDDATKWADHIIIMNNGSIEAIGTHDELLASNPIYQEVYYSQNKGGEQDEK